MDTRHGIYIIRRAATFLELASASSESPVNSVALERLEWLADPVAIPQGEDDRTAREQLGQHHERKERGETGDGPRDRASGRQNRPESGLAVSHRSAASHLEIRLARGPKPEARAPTPRPDV